MTTEALDITGMTDMEKLKLAAELLDSLAFLHRPPSHETEVEQAYHYILGEEFFQAIQVCTGNWEPSEVHA